MQYQRSLAKKLWLPYSAGTRSGRVIRFPPPRAKQLLQLLRCAIVGHRFSQWRVEDEEWFHYVDAPEPWAWHTCSCGTIERVPGEFTFPGELYS